MAGTLLQQLSEEYQVILENIKKTKSILVVKRGALPEMRAASKEAGSRFKLGNELVEEQKQLEVMYELVWAYVEEKKEV